MKFYKIWRTYSWLYSGHKLLQVHFQRSTCCPYLRRFILMASCFFAELKQRLLVEWRKLDHLIVVAAISQWRPRLSTCVRAHGGHFEHLLWCIHDSVC